MVASIAVQDFDAEINMDDEFDCFDDLTPEVINSLIVAEQNSLASQRVSLGAAAQSQSQYGQQLSNTHMSATISFSSRPTSSNSIPPPHHRNAPHAPNHLSSMAAPVRQQQQPQHQAHYQAESQHYQQQHQQQQQQSQASTNAPSHPSSTINPIPNRRPNELGRHSIGSISSPTDTAARLEMELARLKKEAEMKDGELAMLKQTNAKLRQDVAAARESMTREIQAVEQKNDEKLKSQERDLKRLRTQLQFKDRETISNSFSSQEVPKKPSPIVLKEELRIRPLQKDAYVMTEMATITEKTALDTNLNDVRQQVLRKVSTIVMPKLPELSILQTLPNSTSKMEVLVHTNCVAKTSLLPVANLPDLPDSSCSAMNAFKLALNHRTVLIEFLDSPGATANKDQVDSVYGCLDFLRTLAWHASVPIPPNNKRLSIISHVRLDRILAMIDPKYPMRLCKASIDIFHILLPDKAKVTYYGLFDRVAFYLAEISQQPTGYEQTGVKPAAVKLLTLIVTLRSSSLSCCDTYDKAVLRLISSFISEVNSIVEISQFQLQFLKDLTKLLNTLLFRVRFISLLTAKGTQYMFLATLSRLSGMEEFHEESGKVLSSEKI
ncbi:hypothetical protein HDU76_005314 [Blyttiomyces sp. JEL0837]|nr:hypothetical protein HDU76_005314 [Blyttiomyces sp. JEL0837]